MKKLTMLMIYIFMFSSLASAEVVKINHISLNLEDVNGYVSIYDSSLEKSYITTSTKYIKTYTKKEENNKFLCDVHIAIHNKMTNLNIESKNKHLLIDVAEKTIIDIKNKTKELTLGINNHERKSNIDSLKIGELLFVDDVRSENYVSITIMSKVAQHDTQFYHISNIIHLYLLNTSFVIYSNGYTANINYINDTIAAVKKQSGLFIDEIQRMNSKTK